MSCVVFVYRNTTITGVPEAIKVGLQSYLSMPAYIIIFDVHAQNLQKWLAHTAVEPNKRAEQSMQS